MSRVVVVLFLALLIACGVFLFFQLDRLTGRLGPNEPDGLAEKQAFLVRFVDALQTGKTDALAAVLPTKEDVEAFLMTGEAKEWGAGAAMRKAVSSDGLEAAVAERRAEVVDTVARIREEGPADVRWNRIALDERDDENIYFLVSDGALLGDLYFGVRCGPSLHQLRIADCARLKRGWVAFGGIEHVDRTGGHGCGPFAAHEKPVTFVFAIEFGDMPAAERPAQAAQVLEAVRTRLAALHFDDTTAQLKGDGEITFQLPPLSDARRDRLIDAVLREGSLEFRIEVLPDAVYARRIAKYGYPPKITRTGIWHGDETAFAKFKKEEIERWRPDGATYKPSDARYRLVQAHGKDGSDASHFHVVEADGRDGSILENALVSQDERGLPVVVYDIRSSAQDGFEEWTRTNIGVPMAILVDGQYRTAPVIIDALRRKVQIMLGDRGTRAAKLEEARTLAALLAVDPLPLPLTLKSIHTAQANEETRGVR